MVRGVPTDLPRGQWIGLGCLRASEIGDGEELPCAPRPWRDGKHVAAITMMPERSSIQILAAEIRFRTAMLDSRSGKRDDVAP